MSGIVGIEDSGRQIQVEHMLDKISHRGTSGSEIIGAENGTLGVVWTESQTPPVSTGVRERTVQDEGGNGHFARAQIIKGNLLLVRDQLGVAPLYYGRTEEGVLCFASEVKALLEVTHDVHKFPPGHLYYGGNFRSYYRLKKQPPLRSHPQHMARELCQRLATAVKERIKGDVAGTWLSGGLDSSALAALARPHVDDLHTFVAGLPGAPDLDHAFEMAAFINSEHHEVIVSLDDLLHVLPDVIYHLESFDALLVRSSITNYLVAEAASRYVSTVFSGEGGDELFAGYHYLKDLHPTALEEELIDITGRLDNTALQRVDRSAAAHSIKAHVGFLDPHVVYYALRIPAKFKLHNGIEKWILRQAMDGILPEDIVQRRKAKFWEGAGVGEILAKHAENRITDGEFTRERVLPNRWILNTKEELLYYRCFCEHFGELKDLSWMGRTKNVPQQ
ncbi:MAG: asparagine synthase [Theionarchaea archaeon]|nr:asparagine synthase [Theionarchaea archaeon]